MPTTVDHFLRSLFPALLLLLTAAGCAAVPMVEDPVPAAELTAFIEAMDRAANPDGISCSSWHQIYTGVVEAIDTPVQLETIWRREPAGLYQQIDIEGMPRTRAVYNGTDFREIIEDTTTREPDDNEKQITYLTWLQGDFSRSVAHCFSDLAMERETVDINGIPCRRLVGRLKDIPDMDPVEFFVGDHDKRLYRSKMEAPSPMGDIPVTTDFTDYRLLNGLLVPTQFTQEQLGMRIRFYLTKFTCNQPVDERIFAIDEDED